MTDHDPHPPRPPLQPESAAAPARPDRWQTHPPLEGVPDPHPRPLPPAPPAPFTLALAVIIGAVALVQVLVFLGVGRGPAVWAAFGADAYVTPAALDPERVRGGAWWLLLTAELMHGGPLHFILNFSALRSLGKSIEWRAPRGWVPVVFLVSALGASVASLVLPPETRSVGASGGLMGMFGFLLVMAHRRRQHMPAGFLSSLVINIALIAGLGFIYRNYIDNAGHLGGIVVGAAIGFLVVPDGATRWDPRGGPGLERAGIASLVILAVGAVIAILAMLGLAFLP